MQDGQATSTLLLLAQVGGYVLMFIAGIETDIDRMREASVTAFVVALSGVIWPFLLGAGVGTSPRTFLDNGVLPGRSADGDERFDFRAHADGRRADGLAGRQRSFLGAAVIDDVMGLFVLAFLAASTDDEGRGVWPRADGQRLAAGERCARGCSHPLIVQMTMISVCVAVFFVVGYGRPSAGSIR